MLELVDCAAKLSTHQRRVRSLQSISARNLRSGQSIQSANLKSLMDLQHRRSSSSVSSASLMKQSNALMSMESLFDVYFALYTRSNWSAREPFYVGEVLTLTCNPDWSPLDFSSMSQLDLMRNIMSADGVIVQIWARKSVQSNSDSQEELDLDTEERKSFALLVEWDVDFSGLAYIGGELHLQQYTFPDNTILFRIDDEYYTAQQCLMSKTSVQLSSFSTLTDKFIKVFESQAIESCSMEFIIDICRKERQIRQANDEIKSLENRLDKLSVHKNRLQITELRQRISKLERLKRLQSTIVTDASKRCEKLKQLIIIRQAKIQQHADSQKRDKPALDVTRKILNEKDIALKGIESKMNSKCVDLVFQLQEIYPLQTINDELCLRKIPLSQLLQKLQLTPSDTKTHDDVAACLGHAAHLTLLLSRYLHIPLRYHIIPSGSRSYIIDEITTMPVHEPPFFPLFIQRAEKYRFDYAIMLLNRNIEQILNVLHESENASRDVLKNLLLIYQKLSKQ